MATGETQLQAIADQLAVQAAATRTLAAVEAAKHAAKVRAQYGLDPDPHSDGIWGDRCAAGLPLKDAADALAQAAKERA